MEYFILFSVGILELFLGTVNFKFTQRSRLFSAAFSTYIHVLVWAYIILALFEGWHPNWITINSYAIGCAVGTFLGIKYDDIIDKKITRIQRRGRKVKRGKFFGRKR